MLRRFTEKFSRSWALVLAATLALGGTFLAFAPMRAAAAPTGTVVAATMPAGAADIPVNYQVYLPAGYETGETRYPTLYLYHGRGDTNAAWLQAKPILDELIAAGQIPPVVAVMPDSPWNQAGNYYVDSTFTGSGTLAKGEKVETAMTSDLIAHVDAKYRTFASRDGRAVGGYSMGGYGALRHALAHRDMYAAAVVLSPAVYVPNPPTDSSAREFGAFGDGASVFDEGKYQALNYPALLPLLDPTQKTHLFIAVGDDEWMNPNGADAQHDLDFEAARLYNTVRRSPAITAEFRVLNGGHSWDVWGPAFREGVINVMGHLKTSMATPLTGSLLGTAGDDRAGGVLPMADGGEIVALSVEGDLYGSTAAGALDGLVVKRDAAGEVVWATRIGTSAADRLYGIEAAPDGGVYIAGYTRGDLDGKHPQPASDDAFVARLTADGSVKWITQFGDRAAADRIYATAPTKDGGLLVAGYTKGKLGEVANAGDKDGFITRVDAAGQVVWTTQVGGPGEDKALAIAEGSQGEVYAAGMASGGLPGVPAVGDMDGWVAKFSPAGVQEWIKPVASTGNDQVVTLAVGTGGDVYVGGFTSGTLGGAAVGDKDAFVRKMKPSGETVWTTQFGSAGDDRGTDLVVGSNGVVHVVGHTNGQLGVSAGGTDVFVASIAADGMLSGVQQLGTPERDGADQWDEGNLYVALDGRGRLVLTGLTYGSVPGAANQGSGDVFVMNYEEQEATPTPRPPTATPTTPSPGKPPVTPTGSSSSAAPSTSPQTSSTTPFDSTPTSTPPKLAKTGT